VFETYFCPNCANKFSSDSSTERVGLTVKCPKCNTKAELRAPVIFILGLIAWGFFGMMLFPEAIIIANAFLFGLSFIGFIQVFKEQKAYNKNKAENEE